MEVKHFLWVFSFLKLSLVFSQSPPPGTETRQNSADIRYNVVNGAALDIFNLFAPNIGGTDGLVNHGCWGAKLNP